MIKQKTRFLNAENKLVVARGEVAGGMGGIGEVAGGMGGIGEWD